MATHYEILGAPAHATHDELRRAYHRQARRHHPDARPGADVDAVERARLRMARINAAWAVLGDTGRRRAYDAQIGVVARPSPSPAPPPPEVDDDPFVLEDDEDTGPRGPADLFVFVPVGLLALAVATFAFSVLAQSPTLEWAAVILLPFAALAFVITPLFVLFARARARAKT